ncbi:MAG: fdxN element excision controlling factor protein [Cyanothece sp. SIO2G6]|nr:fdxN element excision controlling factor protein [Cyanothece sp. SIO2G6]
MVEVKSFIGRSFIHELEQAIGQYVVYRDILEEINLDFQPYLAITKAIWNSNFQRKLPQMLVRRNHVNLIIVDSDNEVVEQWIH